MHELSQHLVPIYDLELRLGNRVRRIDRPAGSLCPLGVVFEQPLHISEIRTNFELKPFVLEWECNDPHYPLEKGFKCLETGHVLSGPIR